MAFRTDKPEFAAQSRELPPAPAFLQTVQVTPPKLNEDPADIAARYRAGLGVANRIIVRGREWYSGVRKDYANPTPAR